MIKVKYVKTIQDDWYGDARLYKLSEEIEYESMSSIQYVVVSAANEPIFGPETYIFATDSEGTPLSWAELPGSYKGGLDHKEAIRLAGWEVED